MPYGHQSSIAVRSERQGYGSFASTAQGHYLFVDSITADVGQTFIERSEKLVYGRADKASTRTKGPQIPKVEFTFQPRTDDMVNVLMAHFQKFIGTNQGSSGTTLYTFVPEKGDLDWVGSSWGAGSYTSPSGDAYTIEVSQRYNDTDSGTNNTMIFKNCIVDKLVFDLSAGEDFKLTASCKSGTLDHGTRITVTPNNAVFGSYSTYSPLQWFEGTFTIFGETQNALKIKSLQITTQNQTTEDVYIGKINPKNYEMGKYKLEGQVSLDAPDEVLRLVGSMVADRGFSITGTLYNGDDGQFTINVPNCKYQAFTPTVGGASEKVMLDIPFLGYESEDGLTAPITINVITQGLGTYFNVL